LLPVPVDDGGVVFDGIVLVGDVEGKEVELVVAIVEEDE